MEPITLAISAFSAVKAGVAAGKEITSLAKDIGKFFDAIEDAKGSHAKKKNSVVAKTIGVNEEALSTFMAQQKAKDMEEQLREIIIYSRGMSAWQELLRLRVQIKKERQAAERKARQERQDMITWFAVVAAMVVGVGALVGFIFWLKTMRG